MARQLVGSTTAQATATATLSILPLLSVTTAAVAGTQGTVVAPVVLLGQAAATATSQGTVRVVVVLAGATDASAQSGGAAITAAALVGAAATTASSVGVLSVVPTDYGVMPGGVIVGPSVGRFARASEGRVAQPVAGTIPR